MNIRKVAADADNLAGLLEARRSLRGHSSHCASQSEHDGYE